MEATMGPTAFMTWLIAHPSLFAVGLFCAIPRLLGRWSRYLNVRSQIVSWASGVCFLAVLIFYLFDGINGLPFFVSGPLCCLVTGLAFGLKRKKVRLLPLGLVAATIIMLLYGLIFIMPGFPVPSD